MRSWEQLDHYLDGLTRRLGGMAYLFSDAGKVQLSPPRDHQASALVRFEQASATVRELFGADCFKRGRWKRHLHHQDGNWFMAEPLLAYHLVVLFDAEYSDDVWLTHVMDHARPVLIDLIAGLPPLDGGRQAIALERDP
jgi:hypothetical protein